MIEKVTLMLNAFMHRHNKASAFVDDPVVRREYNRLKKQLSSMLKEYILEVYAGKKLPKVDVEELIDIKRCLDVSSFINIQFLIEELENLSGADNDDI